MDWNAWIRQIHRWLAIAFTAGVIINIVAMQGGRTPEYWVYLTALIPLFALLATGLYLFVLPHALKWRGRKA